jgi:hypothetical protein
MKPSVRRRKHESAMRLLFELVDVIFEVDQSMAALYSTETQALNETYRTFERLEAAKK